MDYEVDLDPRHPVIRPTVTAETVTLEPAEDSYQRLSDVTSRGGPYAAIYSAAKHTTLSTDAVRSFARRRPSMPMGRTHVVVGREQSIYRLARLFQMCAESIGSEFEAVHALEKTLRNNWRASRRLYAAPLLQKTGCLTRPDCEA
jgi:hypothetical protein